MNNDRITELEQQLEAIRAEIEKLKEEEKAKSEIKPWRADNKGTYFNIGSKGNVWEECDGGYSGNNEHYTVGNYYRTRILAENDAKVLALRGKIRQLRDVFCEGYGFVEGKSNYFIYFSHEDRCFSYNSMAVSPAIGTIYFDTYKHAQQACEILNKELENGNIKI